jgi:outer membrane protein OmpA-like peptidoglycan-associated protein
MENLGPSINTEYSEHSPVISGNDSILIFTARRPESLGAQPELNYYDEDIYIVHKKDSIWGAAKNIGEPVNTKGHDATVSLTSDGTKLFIYRQDKGGEFFRTTFDSLGKSWNNPQRLPAPINSKFYETHLSVSADSSTMYFASDRPGGYGGLDIYISKKIGKNKWSEPKNMGTAVNTSFDEDAPFIHHDGRTFYYSSNGSRSMGGFDIFVTEYDSAQGIWLPPLNMGYPVNTPDDDIYFVVSQSGKYGYYSSGKEGGFGEKDIYVIEFPYFVYPKRFNMTITGIVADSVLHDTLPATVRLINPETGEVLDEVITTKDSAKYSFIIDPQTTYIIEVSTEGFDTYRESFTTPRLLDRDMELKKNFYYQKVQIIEPDVTVIEEIIVQHLYFNFDQYNLRASSKTELDKIAELIMKNSTLIVEIHGHTDAYGSTGYNQKLSEQRASAAIQYLQEKGIDPGRIRSKGFGEIKPIESNETDLGRQFNRRVEFYVYNDSSLQLSSVKLKPGGQIIVDPTGQEEVKATYTHTTEGPKFRDEAPPGRQDSLPLLKETILIKSSLEGDDRIILESKKLLSNLE